MRAHGDELTCSHRQLVVVMIRSSVSWMLNKPWRIGTDDKHWTRPTPTRHSLYTRANTHTHTYTLHTHTHYTQTLPIHAHTQHTHMYSCP